MVDALWLIPAAMVGMIIGVLFMGSLIMASKEDNRLEKRRKKHT